MVIRFAESGDIPGLLGISRECFSEPFTKGNFKSTFNNSLERLLVAEDDGIILGYCDFTLAGPEGELIQIAVSKKAQRKGIGRFLFSEMVKVLKENGVLNLFLEVRRSNIFAQSLYKSFGMTEVGVREGFYNHPKEDALIYRLDV